MTVGMYKEKSQHLNYYLVKGKKLLYFTQDRKKNVHEGAVSAYGDRNAHAWRINWIRRLRIIPQKREILPESLRQIRG